MFGTTFILAVRSISRHKLRSFLTTLGIIIGVAAVVAMVTLGKATTKAAQAQIASLGTNILQVRPGQGFGRGGGGPRPPDFEQADVDAIRDQVEGVTAVAPQAQSSATVIYQGANWSTSINGTTRSFFQVQPWPLVQGRSFSAAEEAAGKAVCIIGNTVRTNLFRGGNAVGERMRVNGISCDVIGVLSTRGQGGFGDQDDVVIMPIKQVQRRFTGNRDIRLMLVGTDPAYDTRQVQESISQVLRERRHIEGGKDDDFNIFDTAQISAAVTGVTTLLTQIVTAVAAISLVVGGIGIMNIMLVSVTERTREIGIRMAVGAKPHHILAQFLVESMALSLIGGLIGVGLGILAANKLAAVFQWTTVIRPDIVVVAVAFSAAVGIGFGLYPARKASQLDPIDALRYE